MIKKLPVVILLCLCCANLFAADWKTEVMGFLEPQRDYAAAAARLREIYPKIDSDDKPNALSFLAFLERKSGRPGDEARRIAEFFESYQDREPLFLILDESLRRDFIEFWARWKASYPLANGLVFLERSADPDASPPSRLIVGLDLVNSAYYKVSDRDGVLEGGFWQPGFHILRLPFTGGCEKSGSLEYNLDLKAGKLVIRKRITIEVDVQSMGPVLPLAESPGAPDVSPRTKPISGEVSLYIDDELILTSKKIVSVPPPIKFKLPGPSAPGTKPFMAPRKDIPQFNGVSILDAVGLLYKTIKDLGRKKKEAAVTPPVYRKAAQVAFTFSKPGSAGKALPFKALVSVKASNGTVLDR